MWHCGTREGALSSPLCLFGSPSPVTLRAAGMGGWGWGFALVFSLERGGAGSILPVKRINNSEDQVCSDGMGRR